MLKLAEQAAWVPRLCGVALALAVVDFLTPLPAPSRAAMRAVSPARWGQRLILSILPREIVCEADELLHEALSRNYLLCYHPHSVYCIAAGTINAHIRENHGIFPRWGAADVLFSIPFIRRVYALLGCLRVSARALREELQRPYPWNMVVLAIGGIAEMFYGIDGREQIVLARRSGFCRVALQSGTPLVPCYILGANRTFTRYFGPHSLAARLTKVLKVTLAVWTDRFGVPFGQVPHGVKLLVLIGKPIEVERVDEPTADQVSELHARYVIALADLFDRNKAKLPGYEDEELLLETGLPASEFVAAPIAPRLRKA